MREWVVPIIIETVDALTMNKQPYHRVRSRRVKTIREEACRSAQEVGVPPLERFTAELHYIPPTRQRRDPENWVPTSKAVVDGLVLAGVAPDDCPPYFVPSTPVMDEPLKGDYETRFYVIVRELPTTVQHACPVPGCRHNEETP